MQMTEATTATMSTFTHVELVSVVARLQGFARSLTRNSERAEDLLQDTIVRAVTSAHRYQAGTNLHAWMCTILRNQHYTNLRKDRMYVRSFGEAGINEPSVPPNQEINLEFKDFRRAFSQLSEEHRAALTLVGVDGLSYAAVAVICKCPIGTIKSRVSRGRLQLRWILDRSAPDDRSRGTRHIGGSPKKQSCTLAAAPEVHPTLE
jgi:RNA polymerase sigma-70 factor (ECF subfamily)